MRHIRVYSCCSNNSKHIKCNFDFALSNRDLISMVQSFTCYKVNFYDKRKHHCKEEAEVNSLEELINVLKSTVFFKEVQKTITDVTNRYIAKLPEHIHLTYFQTSGCAGCTTHFIKAESLPCTKVDYEALYEEYLKPHCFRCGTSTSGYFYFCSYETIYMTQKDGKTILYKKDIVNLMTVTEKIKCEQ